MKWEKVTSTIGHSAYALWNNGRKLVTLVFNPSSNAARIESESGRRVFLIRKEGFLRNRTVLRNEYGVRIGCAGSENNRNFIQLEDQRFFYEVAGNNPQPALAIYSEGQEEQPLAICEIDSREKTLVQELQAHNQLTNQAQYSLLMALCWYLLPLARDNRISLNIAWKSS